jgi:protein-L-isoaspartate(D-aspartate) O-methyltransferase
VEKAPYDAIVVAAAAPHIPEALVEQLKVGGRMIVPVGSADLQQLTLLIRHDGSIQTKFLDACRFVPLVGHEGYMPL